MARSKQNTVGRRVAIVGGLRTPFVKSGTVFRSLSALQIAKPLISELIARTNLTAVGIDRIIYGQVVPNMEAPNIAREIVLGCGLPHSIDAYSVSRACATSTQAIVDGAMAIMTGDANVVLCGGAESLSRPPISFSDGMVDVLMAANAARSTAQKIKAFAKLRPSDFMPVPPALKEAFTGLSMGESAEVMAKLNGIARDDQDRLALASHQNAAAAWEKGIFTNEVMSFQVPPKFDTSTARDGIVRSDTSLEKLAGLKPVFDRKHGTITAGNSSPLTDGASCVILMAEETAKAHGYTPLAYVKSWGFAGIDPNFQLLQAPVLAIPKALEHAGLVLDNIDLFDMHEAFAAQVLSNIVGLRNAEFCKAYAGLASAVGDVPMEKLNIYGGSIAIGHPFAATGARQALTMAHELSRRGGGIAMCTQCAAGGLGAALIIER